MRKLWVKAWVTLDGVFDADTMDHWWPPADEAAVDYARRIEYIGEEYSKGDVYLLGRSTYEMLWPGWSTQTDTLGSILNHMKKYVVSTTLETVWVLRNMISRLSGHFEVSLPNGHVE